MSDKSDEELVGDVDFDFDPLENKESSKRNEHPKGKSTMPSKQALNKKKGVKFAAMQDDLLQAFAIGATSVQKMAKAGCNVKKSSSVKGKGKSDSVTNTSAKRENQEKVTEVAGEKTQGNEKVLDAKAKASEVKKTQVKGKVDENKIKENTLEKKSQAAEEIAHKKTQVKEEVDKNKDVKDKDDKKAQDRKENLVKNSSVNMEINQEIHSPQKKTPAKEEVDKDVKDKADKKAQDRKENLAKKSSAKMEVNSPQQGTAHETSSGNVKSRSDQQVDLKRKADNVPGTRQSAKLQRTEVEGSQTVEEQIVEFTEDDYKSMDSFLADQMLSKSKENIISKNGAKYTVQVSPLEIADLAHPSLQQLIVLHPTLSLMFKHQTVKFKKKKGYAEAVFLTMTELKEFVYQLTQIKVVERRVDVTIKALDQSDVLSFVIHLNRNSKLLNLLDSGEDPMINKPMPIGKNPHRVQFEKVPHGVSGAFMHSMFPFTNNVLITRSKVGHDKKTSFQGPVSVVYVNSKWLEAVMDCCSDFTVNDFPLSIIGDHPADDQQKTDLDEKREAVVESEQRPETRMDTDQCNDDDPVSNMTRDVCADMLESIQKLKELEPNNPNMKKILEMQNQLNILQNTLGKSQNPTLKKFARSKHGTSDRKTENSSEMKLTPTERSHREMKYLEEKFEEATRAEQQKEEQMKRHREMEAKKKREFEKKRKSQWVKNILSDFKKEEGVVGERLSVEAEKILQQREQRLKEREEEVEKRRKEEEEKLKEQQEREEKQREAERKRLIEKIEESRLKDTQKFSSSQLLWNPSSREVTGHGVSSPTSGGKRNRDGDHYDQTREHASLSKNDGKFAPSSSADDDDGVDERLADFARELVQQGKIEKGALPCTLPNRSADGGYASNREELDDDMIMTEGDYQHLLKNNYINSNSIPGRHLKVRIASVANRLCPVPNCPSKTNFRSVELFMDHWVIFHQAQTTMRFCPRCTAYFMNPEELENHIMKHHWLSSKEAVELVRNARTKVITNPSYRDPFPFIPPLLPS